MLRYVHLYTHTHILALTYTHTHTHAHIHAHTHTHVHTYSYTYTHTYTRTHKLKQFILGKQWGLIQAEAVQWKDYRFILPFTWRSFLCHGEEASSPKEEAHDPKERNGIFPEVLVLTSYSVLFCFVWLRPVLVAFYL